MRIAIKLTAVLMPLGLLVCGCRAAQGVVDHAGWVQYQGRRATSVMLAAQVEPARRRLPSTQEARRTERKDEEKPAARKPPPDNQGEPERQPPAGKRVEQKPSEGEASREPLDKKQRPRRLPYTTPSAVGLLALGAVATSGEELDDSDDEGDDDQVRFVGGGRESAESSMGIVGRPGLTAPAGSVRPGVGRPLMGRPGLQQGPASLLGFAAMGNIFTPQMNLLSGPMGRCRDLSMAGFFNHSRAQCEAHFVRR